MTLRNYKAVKVSELVRFAANSRTHSKEQIAKIVRSIDEFGFTNPLLIDENNMIIAGHGRLEAALAIGMQVVPCIELPGLSDAQKSALVIADNKIALDAGWDMKILLDQFEFLKGHDFDLTLTGFGEDELLDIFPPSEVEAFCDENDLPANHKTRSEYGDVWLLGNHRLVCGDSTCATDVDKLLNGQHPNTMITDPPYGVKLDQSWRDKALGDKALGKGNNLVIDNDDRADWYDNHTNPGEYVYDPFGGSGTLMIACEKTNRRALIMELDPKYCDIIIQRYENYTGKKAEREMTDGEAKEREIEAT